MSDFKATEKQQRVAAAIWRWQENGFEQTKPSVHAIRFQALWRLTIMLSMAAVFYYFSADFLSYFILSMAVLISGSVIFSPTGLYLKLEKVAEFLMKGIGILIQGLIFPLIYFLFFAVYGKIFRRKNKGPIKSLYDKNINSYWQEASLDFDRDRQF